MVDWIYEGPYDHFEAQKIKGGYPFVNDNLKDKGLNHVFTNYTLRACR